MRLLEALKEALKLYEGGTIHAASKDVKETIYRGCVGTTPDLVYYLFDQECRVGALRLLQISGMSKEEAGMKIHTGILNKLKNEIKRVEKKDIVGKRGNALFDIACVLLETHFAVDEDDINVLDRLSPIKRVLDEKTDYPKNPPDPNVVLDALNKVDKDTHDLIMSNIFFITRIRDRESQLTTIPSNQTD